MKKMRLKILLLVLGAVAAPRLSPSPLGLLTHEDPPKISCFAPRRYTGSTFELLAVGAGVPLQSVTAAPGQHHVEFTLDGASSRCYRCRYRSYNGSAWQTSELSAEIVVTGSGVDVCHPPTTTPTDQPLPTSATLRQDPSWLLPVVVGATVLALVVLVAAALVAWRGRTHRAGPRPPAPSPSFPMTTAPSSLA
ncbi:protein HIDE1 isoform 2-T2 [Porphyrio hochstetteri]